jgi:hypothetical protein
MNTSYRGLYDERWNFQERFCNAPSNETSDCFLVGSSLASLMFHRTIRMTSTTSCFLLGSSVVESRISCESCLC